MSGNHRAFHAQFRIQDAINARLEEISFRKGVATGVSTLLFLAGVGVVTAELAGQANPASGTLSGQAGGASAVTPPLGSAPAPASPVSAAPSHPHARSRSSSHSSSHPAANRSASVTVSTTSVPGQSSGAGGVQASAPAVSAIPSVSSRPSSGPWWPGGHDRDGWHHGDRGWDGWGPGGGDPWHGGHHW